MRLVRTVLMLLLMTGWAAAQCGHAMGSDDEGKKDSTADHKMSCCCCGKDAAKAGGMKCGAKDAPKADEKDAAKSEARSEAKAEGAMTAGGMSCCAKMGKDAAGGGMSCGSKKDDAGKTETLPAERMK